MGGTRARTQERLGQQPRRPAHEVNGKPAGLDAIGASIHAGEAEIGARRPWACSRDIDQPLHIDHISLASPHIFR